MSGPTVSSLQFLLTNRLRVEYDPASVEEFLTHYSAAGFALTSFGMSLPLTVCEETGNHSLDLIVPTPVYQGGASTLAYNASAGIVTDLGGNPALSFSATSVIDTLLPLPPVEPIGITNPQIIKARNQTYTFNTVVPFNGSIYAQVNPVTAGALCVEVYALYDTALFAMAVSPNNGRSLGFGRLPLTNEFGISETTVRASLGHWRSFLLRGIPQPYVQILSTSPVSVVIHSGFPLVQIPGPLTD